MKPKKYSTSFPKLSNLIFSLSGEQQGKLLKLAFRLQNGEHLFFKKGAQKIQHLFLIMALGGLGDDRSSISNPNINFKNQLLEPAVGEQ